MANASRRNDQGATSSGHGALGIGGEPSDDPRDIEGGHEDLTDDDRTRAVGGASGSTSRDRRGGEAAGETDRPRDTS